ncbi:MAG: hypothetical protein AAFV43_05505 [Planctomycetota bacterium]
MIRPLMTVLLLNVLLLCSGASTAFAHDLTLARGRVVAKAPDAWEKVEPRSMMLEGEFAVAAPEGVDAAPARLTMMAAGGSIDQNLQRWVGQFRGTEGGADMSAADIKTSGAGETEVTTIDVAGTYMDGPPRGPKEPKDGYRLLGAIVPLSDGRAYFFKLVGPQSTIDAAADGFQSMIDSVEVR